MTKFTWLIGLGAMTVSGAAAAQQAGPDPMSGNASKAVSINREENAGYNKVIGSIDRVKAQPQTKAPSTAVPASAADVKPGSPLRDSKGLPIGMIDSVEADVAVVATTKAKIKVPLIAFGKDDSGLLLGITAARFDELVAKALAAN